MGRGDRDDFFSRVELLVEITNPDRLLAGRFPTDCQLIHSASIVA
jgi:hypothetical protein